MSISVTIPAATRHHHYATPRQRSVPQYQSRHGVAGHAAPSRAAVRQRCRPWCRSAMPCVCATTAQSAQRHHFHLISPPIPGRTTSRSATREGNSERVNVSSPNAASPRSTFAVIAGTYGTPGYHRALIKPFNQDIRHLVQCLATTTNAFHRGTVCQQSSSPTYARSKMPATPEASYRNVCSVSTASSRINGNGKCTKRTR